MSRRNGLAKAKNRREKGSFFAFPHTVMNHPNFLNMTFKAKSLFVDLASQVKMKEGGTVNNGDLCAAYSVMKERGWRSKETLENAIKELIYYEFITITRRGGRYAPHLYAFTFFAIDECEGKLDVRPTRAPSNEWKKTKPKMVHPRKRKQAEKTESLPRKIDESTPTIGAQVT